MPRPFDINRRRTLAGAALAVAGSALGQGASAAAAERLAFDELYKSFGVLGLAFSDRVVRLKDQDVSIRGYMAPPLKAESDFFVLTREPLAICPFCQSDADWPLDIVVVYLRRLDALAPGGAPITVTGRLEIGSHTDPKTGFVSQLRLADAGYRAA